jgi:hypothetical protein
MKPTRPAISWALPAGPEGPGAIHFFLYTAAMACYRISFITTDGRTPEMAGGLLERLPPLKIRQTA